MGFVASGSAESPEDPETNECIRCGEEQVIGTLMFSAMGVFGTFGAFFLSLLYLCLGRNQWRLMTIRNAGPGIAPKPAQT